MTVLVPPWVAERMELDACLTEADRHIVSANEWERLLRAHDERLEIRYIGDRADSLGGRVVPGRWHVIRRNDPPMIDSAMPLLAADGGYREFGSGDLDRLRSADLRNPDVAKRFFGSSERREEDRRARQEAEREDRVERMTTAAKAVLSPGVSMTDAGGWRYRKERLRG